ncbi:MAG TPA: metalloregulator ArsR/SmtB family transcription factor [Thermoplasmata archaeon]|nr:metalloregulator ArsR/SmtB family transcription factor [Thermoplasmata archaeon]
MNEEVYELHARLCKSLSSPVRLKVLDLLRDRERAVKDLVSLAAVSQPNLSLHLKYLWDNGVLERRQEGTAVYYRVSHPEIFEAIDILRRILAKKIAKEQRLTRRVIRS